MRQRGAASKSRVASKSRAAGKSRAPGSGAIDRAPAGECHYNARGD